MSSLVGQARGLLCVLAAVACSNDTGELFTPVGSVAPGGGAGGSGAAGSVAIAPPTTTAADPSQPTAPSASGELGPVGALPVDPTAASPGEGVSATPVVVAPAADVNPAQLCPAVVEPLLLDFATANGGPAQALFGDFSQLLSGGTFIYPAGAGEVSDAGIPATPGLVSDVAGGDWHITGRVVEAAGFGLFFNCQLIDAARFAGIAFRVSGQAGPGNLVAVRMRTAGNEVARAWFIEAGISPPATFGRCIPASSQYDGTCEPANADVVVTPAGSDVVVRFDQLAGGRPESGVNPAELIQIEWALPLPEVSDAGAVTSYDVDLRVDDIRFVEAL